MAPVDRTGTGDALQARTSGTGRAGFFEISRRGNASPAHEATTNGTGPAGRFNGDVTVTGNLAKGGGLFVIDHPLDPKNKYLYHSFVESPDMMNIYNGNVELDGKGEA